MKVGFEDLFNILNEFSRARLKRNEQMRYFTFVSKTKSAGHNKVCVCVGCFGDTLYFTVREGVCCIMRNTRSRRYNDAGGGREEKRTFHKGKLRRKR